MIPSTEHPVWQKKKIHPLIIRLTHWVNVVALYIMVTSGLRIYNASPIFGFSFPEWATLGGWLAGARQWHFFAMWIFVFNGLVWFTYNIVTRHGKETTLFRGRDAKGVFPMVLFYLRIYKVHPTSGKYNALQKLAYTSVILLAALGVLSGIAIYWPVQMQFVTSLLGGYDTARIVHFLSMSALVIFFLGHIVMVVIAGWSNFVSIFTGKGYAEQDPQLVSNS